MIRLTGDQRDVGGVALGAIWIGDSADEQVADLVSANVGAILNVAQDMLSTRGWWHGVEAMHVGLVDGPGNEQSAYCAAVLALHALLKRHNTLVCCHTGGRSLAVAIMFLNLGIADTWREWGDWLDILQERVDADLPAVNEVHAQVFDAMLWSPLAAILGGK